MALVEAGRQTCVLARGRHPFGPDRPADSVFGCNVHANSLSLTGVVVSGSAEVETPGLSSSGGSR